MINRIIHQIWISEDDREVPRYCEELSKTWIEHHPDCKYILWNKESLQNLVKNKYPYLEPLTTYFIYNIQLVDFYKYLVLYDMGGVYVDMDYECIKPIFEIFNEHDCYLSEESSEFRVLGNAFIASKNKSKFLKYVIESLKNYLRLSDSNREDKLNYVLATTGPGMISNAYDSFKHKDNVYIIPYKFLSPISALESRTIFRLGDVPDSISDKMKDSYAVHYFFSLWIN